MVVEETELFKAVYEEVCDTFDTVGPAAIPAYIYSVTNLAVQNGYREGMVMTLRNALAFIENTPTTMVH